MNDHVSPGENYRQGNATDEDAYYPEKIEKDDDDDDDDDHLELLSSGLRSFQDSKWARHRKHYNDQYLNIFRQTFETSEDDPSSVDLTPTQLGAVSWQALEKTALFAALGRIGRHDLQALSQLVKTKSELEVRSYLEFLRKEDIDRQLFEAQPRNISHADIPAAIEIGSGCEAALERAAEALSVFQEQFDLVAGQRSNKLWLIDQTIASRLDESTDAAQLEATESSEPNSEQDDAGDDPCSTKLFHLSTFLDLSEKFFMNQGDGDTWHNLAEPDQHPALTMDLITHLHDIVVNYTRRLVQSILFVAKSRLRSSTSLSYRPSLLVRAEDVSTALDILNVECSLWKYWIQMARRNRLLVVTKKSAKRFNPNAVIPYDTVEDALSVPGRSLSAMPDNIVLSEGSSTESVEEETGDESDVTNPLPEVEVQDGGSVFAGPETELSYSDEGDAESSDGEVGAVESTISRIPISKRKRQEDNEADIDEYMEQLDQKARQAEELKLLQYLGHEPDNETVKAEDIDHLYKRPRLMRKTITDAKGWSVVYQSEWETRNGQTPMETVAQRPSDTKAKKVATVEV